MLLLFGQYSSYITYFKVLPETLESFTRNFRLRCNYYKYLGQIKMIALWFRQILISKRMRKLEFEQM